uniref:Expression site-associated protein 1 n=1 Tax=Trypanosoma brucei gambiense TaxID=31285 RepID=G9I6J2_TRYBG|nr:expression site-associated protein 1 [Trypanosoma brucei gambiense]
MKVTIADLVLLLFFVICTGGTADESRCTLVDDHYGKNLHESVCYLKCLSDALNKLYSDGEKRLFVNEEAYANASRMLDDMEGRAGASLKYLSVVSSAMGEQDKNLENLISCGNEMGNLVAKAGGLFAEVNESVRAVREDVPTTLMTANKYYAAIAEIARTVWDDVKAVKLVDVEAVECKKWNIIRTGDFSVECGDHTCPLGVNVSERALKRYKDGCLEINVMTESGQVSKCFNLPRMNLYKNGAGKHASDVFEWPQSDAGRFQLELRVKNIFDPLIASFAAGQPPSVLAEMMSNITSIYFRFNAFHSNFTSILLATKLKAEVDNTGSTI